MGSDSVNHPSEIKYFDFRENQNVNVNNSINNIKSTVKLEFSLLKTVKNKKYSIKVVFDDNSTPFQTETLESQSSSNPLIFNTCYLGDYFYEKTQKIKIILITEEKEEGFVEALIGNILGSLKQTLNEYIKENILIEIKAQEIKDIKSKIEFKFEAKIDNGRNGISNQDDIISYLIKSDNKIIYWSEQIHPWEDFKPIIIPICLLDKGFTFLILDENNNEIISKDDKIENFNKNINNIYIKFTSKDNSHKINIINKSILKLDDSSFIEYIESGLKIKLILGIDYSKANLTPEHQFSLHYLGSKTNEYQQAIDTCLKIFSKYNNLDDQISLYGFGAKLNNELNTVNDCFNINTYPNNTSSAPIQIVLYSYRNSFNYLKLSDPPNFSPLIQTAINDIKIENDIRKYNILLIFTCGGINDLHNTINALIEGNHFPLSVIIIGVGNGPFKDIINLRENMRAQMNSLNNIKKDNIVTFYAFNNYKNNDINLLNEKIWEKIPQQITQYLQNKKISPKDMKYYIRNSTKIYINDPKQSVNTWKSNSFTNSINNSKDSSSQSDFIRINIRGQINSSMFDHYNSS